jgi:alcohol dehydrogenase, propanol-preferring
MKAMVIDRICNLKEEREPLRLVAMPVPVTGDKEVLVKVSSCGVCHTEIDEIEGRTPPPRFPVVPGHQIVGTVVETGKYAKIYKHGDRVGIAWIHSACGTCSFCRHGNENLCDHFEATGRDVQGGYAEFTSVSEDFAHPIPDVFSDLEAAPLLCAGTIGYRSLRLTEINDGENVGLVGFGASAHLVIQMIRHKYPSAKIFVFARNEKERAFAKKLGAYWAGDTVDQSPEKLHRAIDTTPVWGTIVNALKNLEKGGRLVINAIRKESIDKKALMEIDYPGHLWLEKEIKSVANVTGRDVREFLALAAEIPIKPEVQTYKLEEANRALIELKEGNIQGAKVLVIP